MLLPPASHLFKVQRCASILGCFDADTGKFDFDKFFAYSRFRSHQAQEITQGIIAQEADNYTKTMIIMKATMEEYSPHRQRRLEGTSMIWPVV